MLSREKANKDKNVKYYLNVMTVNDLWKKEGHSQLVWFA